MQENDTLNKRKQVKLRGSTDTSDPPLKVNKPLN